ncbi:MAG TPA: carboxylesterase family protein, partial [Polyangiaceae bacterium]|nr:carboxylesterase family protein [Polyangiaceae bacterium]
LMDQQAALRWVQDEIGAFGGDPSNVTIAGGSAGGVSVCAHLVSPLASGLFAAAVIQSGACYAAPRDASETQGLSFATAAGCPDATSMDCLRQKSAAELLAVDSFSFGNFPVRGDALLPEGPGAAVEAGRFARVPVMIGGTHNEARAGAAAQFPMSEAEYITWLTDTFGDRAQSVLQLYPVTPNQDAFYPFSDVVNDSRLGGISSCWTHRIARAFARQVATFEYEFNDASAPIPTWVAPPAGLVLGASHTSDEAYWFRRPLDTIEPLDGAQRRLSRRMIRYLGAFSDRHDPQVPRESHWPRVDASQSVMHFGSSAGPEFVGVKTDFEAEHHCAVWEAMGR